MRSLKKLSGIVEPARQRSHVATDVLVLLVDPILVWWQSCGTVTVPRLPDTAEVVRHRVSEEDEHVRRYMVALEGRNYFYI